jgi:hypothetical protein
MAHSQVRLFGCLLLMGVIRSGLAMQLDLVKSVENSLEAGCIGGVQFGDAPSRDERIGGAGSLAECIAAVKTGCPDANAATFFRNNCYCEYESCGIGSPIGGWESAQTCLLREVSVAPLDANGCAGGLVNGASSHGGRVIDGHLKFQQLVGTAGSAEECVAMVREQKGDVANGATWLASQSKCLMSYNQSTYMPGGADAPGGWESAKSCFFGYWCGWGAIQQAGTVVAKVWKTTEVNGYCVDGQGRFFDGYKTDGLSLDACQTLCTSIPQCVSLSYITRKDRCVIHTANEVPSRAPEGGWDKENDHQPGQGKSFFPTVVGGMKTAQCWMHV